MNLVNWRRKCMIGAFTVLLLLTPIGIVEAQNPAHLTVTVAGQTLTAGFNNNVTITATNSYYPYYTRGVYPSSTIYDVDLAVSMPLPLQMLGDNHWHYESIGFNQSVAVSFVVYAPSAAIGNSYQASVTFTYRQLGETSYTQESHAVTFSVRGWISLVLYGIQVTPSTAPPGGNVTVSGNLLNQGNLAAFNANVTVESQALASGSSASVYLGQIDPNIVRPFSLLVNFRRNLAEGNYSIVVKVSAIDSSRPSSPYYVQQASRVQIKRTVVQPPSQRQTSGGLIETVFEVLRYLWELFFGWSSLPVPVLTNYSYFSATTAFILAARQAG